MELPIDGGGVYYRILLTLPCEKITTEYRDDAFSNESFNGSTTLDDDESKGLIRRNRFNQRREIEMIAATIRGFSNRNWQVVGRVSWDENPSERAGLVVQL